MPRLAVLAALLQLQALPAPAGPPLRDLAGPPAPPSREERIAAPAPLKSREQLDAEAAWPWYAGAWALNAASTIFAIELGGAREVNPLFRGRAERAIAAKAAVAVLGWRVEVWAARRGGARGARVGRWIFVGLSALVAGYEISVVF